MNNIRQGMTVYAVDTSTMKILKIFVAKKTIEKDIRYSIVTRNITKKSDKIATVEQKLEEEVINCEIFYDKQGNRYNFTLQYDGYKYFISHKKAKRYVKQNYRKINMFCVDEYWNLLEKINSSNLSRFIEDVRENTQNVRTITNEQINP